MVYESIPPSLRTRVKKASRLSEKVDLGTIELTDSEDSEPRPTKRSRIRGGRRSGMLGMWFRARRGGPMIMMLTHLPRRIRGN